MNDLISRSALMEYPFQRGKSSCDEASANMYFLSSVASILEYAKNLPSVPAKVMRHGRWKNGDGIYDVCTACGEEIYQAITMLYCPLCGAKMDTEDGAAHD